MINVVCTNFQGQCLPIKFDSFFKSGTFFWLDIRTRFCCWSSKYSVIRESEVEGAVQCNNNVNENGANVYLFLFIGRFTSSVAMTQSAHALSTCSGCISGHNCIVTFFTYAILFSSSLGFPRPFTLHMSLSCSLDFSSYYGCKVLSRGTSSS